MSAPHLLYLAYGFPPAAKSSAYRMRETANCFAERGWDVTAVTLDNSSWDLEFGLDLTLLDGLHPNVQIVGMPLRRVDLETDLRKWPRARARRPTHWREAERKLDLKAFPEPVFGRWRPVIEDTARRLHQERPADLCLVSPAPYTQLAGALVLHREHNVPIAIDYRDGWSLDVLQGVEAFTADSTAGKIEAELMDAARAVWVVNEPIKQWYAERYPGLAGRLHVVRNGFDAAAVPANTRLPDASGLAFGYVGTVNFSVDQMKAILGGWRLARQRNEVLAHSTLTFRGFIGAGHSRGANAHARLIDSTPDVSYLGPVKKGEVADAYAGFDALLLSLAGGRFVTSGKVYEYAATGLPILSVTQPEHDAMTVLAGRPMWVRASDITVDSVADGFAEITDTTLNATHEQHLQARAAAARFERRRQIEPAVAALAAQFEGARR